MKKTPIGIVGFGQLVWLSTKANDLVWKKGI
jgi:hypothetical protein